VLSMLALDAAPDVAAQARVAQVVTRHTWRMLEAESATLGGGAAVVTPPSSWTGESAWSGAYVTVPPGGSVAFGAQDAPGLVQPVALRSADRSGGATRWGRLGVLSHADAGPQGVSAIPGVREVQTLKRPVAGPFTANQAAHGATALDQPLLESLALSGGGRRQALVRSFAPDRRTATIAVPGSGRTRATSYDAAGRAAAEASSSGPQVSISIPSGGFAIAVR
jgi:hypothetical protein